MRWVGKPSELRDRGAASIGFVLAVPLLLLLLGAVVQFALWYHANNTALAVSRQALASARLHEVTPVGAQHDAEAILDQLGSATLSDPSITVDRGIDTTVVTLHATATQVLPFVEIPIDIDMSGPTERYRSAGP